MLALTDAVFFQARIPFSVVRERLRLLARVAPAESAAVFRRTLEALERGDPENDRDWLAKFARSLREPKQ
jgi:uncharacterized membrane-anchored protein